MTDHILQNNEPQLRQYMELIRKWSPTYNIVSRETLPRLWEVHILNSLQITMGLPDRNKVITDFGSGAGLPAVILAIMGYREVHAVESRAKKCSFLRQVKLQMGLDNLHIHHARIEDIAQQYHTDIITARAFASLEDILKLGMQWGVRELCLLKGASIMDEISVAKIYATKHNFNFTHNLIDAIDYSGGEQSSHILQVQIID